MRLKFIVDKVRSSVILSITALCLAAPAAAEASDSVGLGVAAGVAVPHGGGLPSTEAVANWGFSVDIPILETFAISPSTYLYRVNDRAATDVSINFKFIVPLGRLEIFGGVTAGITTAEAFDPHVGALGGAELQLISNLGVYAQVNYRVLLQDGEDTRDLMVFAGPMFRF